MLQTERIGHTKKMQLQFDRIVFWIHPHRLLRNHLPQLQPRELMVTESTSSSRPSETIRSKNGTRSRSCEGWLGDIRTVWYKFCRGADLKSGF